VFKRQQDAADDWRTDKELAAACKARPRCARAPPLSRGRGAAALVPHGARCPKRAAQGRTGCHLRGLRRLCHPAAWKTVLAGATVRGTRLLDAAHHNASLM